MSDRPIRDAINKLDELPKREAEIGVVKTRDDTGITGQVSTPLGKGWSIAAAGQWLKAAGWSAAAKLGWKGK